MTLCSFAFCIINLKLKNMTSEKNSSSLYSSTIICISVNFTGLCFRFGRNQYFKTASSSFSSLHRKCRGAMYYGYGKERNANQIIIERSCLKSPSSEKNKLFFLMISSVCTHNTIFLVIITQNTFWEINL